MLSHRSWLSLNRRRAVELTDVFITSDYGFFLETNSALPISGQLDLGQGDFYNFARQSVGQQRQMTLAGTLRPQSNFTIEIDGGYAQSLAASREIDGRFLASSLRLTYLFRRNLFLRIFGQVGRERTNYDRIQSQKNYLVSLLFGWEYKPKSHLFLAYIEVWQTETGVMKLGNRVAVLKVSYLWNL